MASPSISWTRGRDVLAVDIESGQVTNRTSGAVFQAQSRSGYPLEVLRHGGIKPLLRTQLGDPWQAAAGFWGIQDHPGFLPPALGHGFASVLRKTASFCAARPNLLLTIMTIAVIYIQPVMNTLTCCGGQGGRIGSLHS
jgi:hypothetical protein